MLIVPGPLHRFAGEDGERIFILPREAGEETMRSMVEGAHRRHARSIL